MSEKKGLLPVVKEEIGHAVQAEMLHSNGKTYEIKMLQRLARDDNPCIANFISAFAMGMETPEARDAAMYSGLLVYRMLESQAEADRMNGDKNLTRRL